MSLGWLEGDLNRVLKCIDNLRNRKSRPNLPGLSRYLKRTHGFSSDKTLHLLDILIARNKVKEVVYKGNISYRNMMNWREPSKPNIKQLESTVNSGIVISTMKALLKKQDRTELKPGVEEAALQASLIEQLDGAVKLDEIRKQIQNQVEKKTIVRTHFNRYILGTNLRDSDDESDMELSEPECDAETKAIKNLESSIDNVVQNIQILSDDDVTEQVGVKKRRKIWQVGSSQGTTTPPRLQVKLEEKHEPPVAVATKLIKPKQIRKRKHEKDRTYAGPRRSSVQEVTDQPNQTKQRRMIKKKTIYDPSEFELTPLRKTKKKSEDSIPPPPLPLGKCVLNRSARRGSSRWREDEFDSDESSNESSVSTSPSPKTNTSQSSAADSVSRQTSVGSVETVGRQTNGAKMCSICSRKANKNQPNILSCSLCLNIAHEDCSDASDMLYIGSKKWRCQDCNLYNPVICSVCHIDSDQQPQNTIMLMCDYCEELYHNTCHYPSVLPGQVQPGTVWRCTQCPPLSPEHIKVKEEEEEYVEDVEDDKDIDITKLDDVIGVNPRLHESYDDVTLPYKPTYIDRTTSPLPQLQEIKTEEKKCNCSSLNLHIIRNSDSSLSGRHKPNEEIPTVDDWTEEQVYLYFKNIFGHDVANAFLSQGIDGMRLLSLSRSYITDKLGLEFGISLKLLYYIRKIQLQTNVLHQLWPPSSVSTSHTL